MGQPKKQSGFTVSKTSLTVRSTHGGMTLDDSTNTKKKRDKTASL